MKNGKTCYIFVDNSNLFIEAQKIIPDTRNPHIRIDIANLVHYICNGREPGWRGVFGSTAPDNSADAMLWEAYKTNRFERYIFQRAGPREKEVDIALACELVKRAMMLPDKDKDDVVFVVVSGDLDMRPAIKIAMDYGVRVEVWGWRKNVSAEYGTLEREEPLLQVKYLDDIRDKITFHRGYDSTHHAPPDANRTVVLRFVRPVDGDAMCKIIESHRMPLYKHRQTTETELVLEFPDIVDDTEDVIVKLRKLFDETEVDVQDWPTYRTRGYYHQSRPRVKTKNFFGVLAQNGEPNEASPVATPAPLPQVTDWAADDEEDNAYDGEYYDNESYGTAPTGAEQPDDSALAANGANSANSHKWTPVKGRDTKKMHHNARRHQQPCRFGIRCNRRGQCGYKHTDWEESMFNDPVHVKVKFKFWKTMRCMYKVCRVGISKNCPYFHSLSEAWCLNCREEGHCKEDCSQIACRDRGPRW